MLGHSVHHERLQHDLAGELLGCKHVFFSKTLCQRQRIYNNTEGKKFPVKINYK